MYDGCDWYLQQIGRVPMLTEAEEIERGNQVQAYMAVIEKEHHTAAERRIIRLGQKAKDRMINANLRLVVSVSKRYMDKCQILCLDDLIQAGNTGLIRAVEKYDPTRGYRFSTYAYCWIKQGIWRSISYSDRTIRLPVAALDALRRLSVYVPEFEREHGHHPGFDEMATECGLVGVAGDPKAYRVRQFLLHNRRVSSLDVTIRAGEVNRPLLDVIGSEDHAADRIEAEEQLGILSDCIRDLPEEQAMVLEHLYGLNGHQPLRLMELSRLLKISHKRLATLEAEAIKTLKSSSALFAGLSWG